MMAAHYAIRGRGSGKIFPQFAYLGVEPNLNERATNTNLTLHPVAKGGKILELGAIVPRFSWLY